MLNECQQKEEYSKAFKAKGEYNSAESFFMTLTFQHQKMISTLIEKHSKQKEHQKVIQVIVNILLFQCSQKSLLASLPFYCILISDRTLSTQEVTVLIRLIRRSLKEGVQYHLSLIYLKLTLQCYGYYYLISLSIHDNYGITNWSISHEFSKTKRK